MAKVEVSTAQVEETSPELKVNVSSHFDHDIPEVGDSQNAEACIKLMTERHGYDAVYRLLKGQYVIAIQAPARSELTEQWHSLPASTRSALIKMPDAQPIPGVQLVATAVLPEAQRNALQARMDSFKLGEKSPRTRTVRVVEDPVEAIARRIQSGELSGEELEATRARVAEMLGLATRRR